MKILIAGDLVPTSSNEKLFENCNIEKLIGTKLLKKWENTPYKIFNLETPICEKGKKIKKEGPCLKSSPKTIKGIKELNPTIVCLANNHIMDMDEEGYHETISLLEQNNINFVGVGKNKHSMKKYHIIKGEQNIGVFACCEEEFTGATDTKCGANIYDEFNTFDDIKTLKQECDKIIVLYHGGKEFYRYPSPKIQKLCRKFVDCGADVIVCQHSHCIGCMEQYKNSYIVYGQGNFIFDRGNDEFWNTSILVSLDFNKDIKIDYIPIIKVNEKIQIPEKKEYNEILNNFYKRSNQIKNKDFVIKNYQRFSDDYITYYLNSFLPKNFILRVINKITGHRLAKWLYKEEDYLHILNVLRCEAHREIVIQGLKNRIGIDKYEQKKNDD